MKSWQLLSRRQSMDKVDFRPDDPQGNSPFAQLRRLLYALKQESAPAEDYKDMDDALEAYREYLFRKIFTGTTHEEYLATPAKTVDYLIAVHEVDNSVFRNSKEKRNPQ